MGFATAILAGASVDAGGATGGVDAADLCDAVSEVTAAMFGTDDATGVATDGSLFAADGDAACDAACDVDADADVNAEASVDCKVDFVGDAVVSVDFVVDAAVSVDFTVDDAADVDINFDVAVDVAGAALASTATSPDFAPRAIAAAVGAMVATLGALVGTITLSDAANVAARRASRVAPAVTTPAGDGASASAGARRRSFDSSLKRCAAAAVRTYPAAYTTTTAAEPKATRLFVARFP